MPGGCIVSDAIFFSLSAFLSAYLAIILTRRPTAARRSQPTRSGLSLLLSGGDVIDATPAGREYLDAAPDGATDEVRLRSALACAFGDTLDDAFGQSDDGRHRLISRDGLSEATIDSDGGLRRITLKSCDPLSDTDDDAHLLRAMHSELELLRANTQVAPFLAWRENAQGQVTWLNRAYLDLVVEVHGADRARQWPLPSLFPSRPEDIRRVPLDTGADAPVRWFECTAEDVGTETFFTASNVTAAVAAEDRLREFMQTLTETFGQLPIGLAIFDRRRHLVLFNPALTDLTRLPIDMLTGRPHLFSFLDALRERQMMPEPRDYQEWRNSIAELEAAAEAGSYAENWCLNDGQTYRVTGRPHPDGAIALLFEDISSEVSLTRRFRSEIDLGQAVLDGLDEAVAVFAAPGVLTMSNRAYGLLWGDRPDSMVTEVSIADATRLWSERSSPTPIWGDLRDFVQQDNQREEWIAPVALLDGRALSCRVQPLAGGATMITFDAGSPRTETITLPPTQLSAI